MVNFFNFLKLFVLLCSCYFDLVHDVEAIHDLFLLLIASGQMLLAVNKRET